MADEETTHEEETTEETTSEETLSAEEAKALREENAKLKKDANARRTERAREEKAKKDAERKAQQESDDVGDLRKALDAETKKNADLQTKLIRSGAKAAAREAGAVDPSVAVRLVDFDAMDDPTDEDELKEVFTALLEEKPYLKGKPQAKVDAGKGGKGNKSGSFNETIRRAAGKS